MGVLRGTKEVGVQTLDTVSTTAREVVKSVSAVGGDVGTAARGAVDGLIESTAQTGGDVGAVGGGGGSQGGDHRCAARNQGGRR